MNFEIGAFFENLSRKSKVIYNLRRITGTLRGDPCTFKQYLAQFFLEGDKRCREKQNTYFMFSNFCDEIRTVCDVM